jgi:outer membrane protein OmpA-like peptidoglycan-associated protein
MQAGARPLQYPASTPSLTRMKKLILMIPLLACATPGEKTAIGAGAGAATGAVVGGALDGWKGAAVGAAVGGVAGGAAGNILDRQAAELKQKDANTKRTADGILVQLKEDLLFETNSDVLKPQAVEHLAAIGDILAKYPQNKIEVRGYADSTGGVAYNEALSLRRAEAVRKVLVERGVKDAQVLAIGMGQKEPVASNTTPGGRAKNRRVELHIAQAK